MRRWSRRAQALGGSLVEVLQAEVHSLLAEFRNTGKGAVRALVLLLAAAAVIFWSLGLLITFGVALLTTRIGLWQAAGLSFLILALIGLALALWGWRSFKRLQAPTQIVRTHVDDHVLWWKETLTSRERRPEVEIKTSAGEKPS